MIGVLIESNTNKYSENLFSYKSVFDGTIPIVKTGGTALATVNYDNYNLYKKGKSIKSTITDTNILTPVYNEFNLSDALTFTCTKEGSYVFSFNALASFSTNLDSVEKLVVTKFVNSVPQEIEFFFETFDSSNLETEKWYNFAQSFYLNYGDVLDFSFRHYKELVSSIPFSNLFLDGFKLELDDRFNGIPTPYSFPIAPQETGWQSITDTVTTQSIPATTDTQIIFTGLEQENGGLVFLNNLGVITPVRLGDTLTVDVAFSFVVPSGSNNHFDFFIKVGATIYRGFTMQMIKNVGDTQFFSQSFTLPVSNSFFTNNAICYINSTVAINLSNKYIAVSRLHKGIV